MTSINKEMKIAIIGLGYVGLPLAIELGKKYSVVGFDKDMNRINDLKRYTDKTLEVKKEKLKSSNILFTNNKNDIIECETYVVTVPTPIDKYNNPDMSPLASASKLVGSLLSKNNIVIYESTVYPGATEEFCVPILEKESKLRYNIDFSCGYSPERINPGDKEHSLTSIKKITSASNEAAADFVDLLYGSIITAGTHKASSIAIAEAAKVIENIQRDVNIALINELSMIFNKLSLDTHEVLEAAGTKWNFLPFRPGLVGGHCIGVDPYYMTHKSTEMGYHPEMILAGRRINDSMGKHIANCTILEMTKLKINPVGAKIGILGLTFKENCPDLRNTKVPDIINYLNKFGVEIFVSDPYADKEQAKQLYNINLINAKKLTEMNAIILAVAHEDFTLMSKDEWAKIMNSNSILMDVKSVYPKNYFNNSKIVHWRL